MTDVITLSSEDEEESVIVPKKRIKLTTFPRTISRSDSKVTEADSCIVVLDDDDDEYKEVKGEPKAVLEKCQSLKVEENARPDGECFKIPIPSDVKDDKAVVKKKPMKVSSDTADLVNDNLNNSRLPSEAPSEANETETELFAFLDDCVQAIKNPEHKDIVQSKLSTIKKLLDKLKKLTSDFDDFNEIIKSSKQKIKNMPEQTILCFNEVFQWLKSSYKDATQAQKTSEQNQKIIKKLEKALLKIRRKIRELEAAEVDFDEEENSTFIQLDRYSSRATQIYKKLCHYRSENPYQGCLLYCRLDFSASKFSEINRALNKKYKNNMVFPTYYDVDKCVRKCVQENEIKISDDDLKFEIKRCFEALGKLLQRRRKMDLYDNQKSYIENTTDPAMENPEISRKICANRTEASKKLDEVMEKYVRLQEKGVEPQVSSESGDSDEAESASECEQDENATENV